MKTILMLITLLSLSANASILCEIPENPTTQKTTVEITDDNRVIVSGAALETPRVFENVSHVWDGHMTGLITAPGLAISYESHFGVIKNVRVTTSFRSGLELIRSISIGSCQSRQM